MITTLEFVVVSLFAQRAELERTLLAGTHTELLHLEGRVTVVDL